MIMIVVLHGFLSVMFLGWFVFSYASQFQICYSLTQFRTVRCSLLSSVPLATICPLSVRLSRASFLFNYLRYTNFFWFWQLLLLPILNNWRKKKTFKTQISKRFVFLFHLFVFFLAAFPLDFHMFFTNYISSIIHLFPNFILTSILKVFLFLGFITILLQFLK